MEHILTTTELNKARELVNKGLSKAAESLTFFMHEKIMLRGSDIEVIPLKEMKLRDYDKGYILITEMMGELKGVCYLLFTEEEAEQLFKVSLPKDVFENESKFKMMSEAILLEIDNIITGSVVTQFSNVLGYKMFGGVPKLEVREAKAVIDYILEKPNKDSFVIRFKADFHAANQNFSPEFVWFLDAGFIEGVKNITAETIL